MPQSAMKILCKKDWIEKCGRNFFRKNVLPLHSKCLHYYLFMRKIKNHKNLISRKSGPLKDEKKALLILNTHHHVGEDTCLGFFFFSFFGITLHTIIKLEITFIGAPVKSLDFLLKDSKEELVKISGKHSSNV